MAGGAVEHQVPAAIREAGGLPRVGRAVGSIVMKLNQRDIISTIARVLPRVGGEGKGKMRVVRRSGVAALECRGGAWSAIAMLHRWLSPEALPEG